MGDPNLKPETGHVLTIGANTKLSENTTLNASVFSSQIKDAIDWAYNDITYAAQAINVDQEKREGMEISTEHKFDSNWSMNASYTYLKVQQDFNNGEGYLTNGSAAPNLYRAGVKYQKDKLIVDLTMRAATGQMYSYLGKYAKDYGPTKAYADNDYFTWDLGMQYKFKKNAKVFAQFNNINNACYQEYSGLYSNGGIKYPAASRNFVVGMEYSF